MQTTVPGPESLDKARAWLDRRFVDIEKERAPFEREWEDLGRYYLPMRPRRFAQTGQRTNRRNSKILDNVGTLASRTMVSGLISLMASPSRPWFELATPKHLAGGDSRAVKVWLREFRDVILGVFERTNFYTELGTLFESGGIFATGAMAMLPDAKKVLRCQMFPIGAYSLAQTVTGEVDTFQRELTMTLRQVVAKFGLDNLSFELQNAWRDKAYEKPVSVRHAIWPWPEGQESRFPFQEVYWEGADKHAQTGEDAPNWGGSLEHGGGGKGILQVSGYYEFPIIVLRWDRNHEDVYGTNSPGLSALSDVKQLQSMIRRYTNASEKTINPPLKADPGMRGSPISLEAGAVTYDSGPAAGGESVTTLHEFRWDFGSSKDLILETRQRINDAFYVNMILMLMSDQRSTPPTAEEIRAREREKTVVLGPVSERFSDDVFDHVIDRAASMLIRQSMPDWHQGEDGIVPLPPQEILDAGMDLRVEYTSEIASAQRMAGISRTERWLQEIGGMAELHPDVLDIPDWDAISRDLAENIGIDPKLVSEEAFVAELRGARAQQQAEQMQAEQAPGMAKAAKDLSETQVGDTTAIDGIVEAALSGE